MLHFETHSKEKNDDDDDDVDAWLMVDGNIWFVVRGIMVCGLSASEPVLSLSFISISWWIDKG